mmetsp:Transcript_27610/g.60374  ORF Transcript_27610/g.60374 Transcript_27610/m.60374 type:complete len:101 (-) Transcript_27610:188-490(-)
MLVFPQSSPEKGTLHNLAIGQQRPCHEKKLFDSTVKALGPRLQESLQPRIEVKVLEAHELQSATPLGAKLQAHAEALDLLCYNCVKDSGNPRWSADEPLV